MKKGDNRAQAPTNWLKWALFVAFIFLVPVPYFMLVVGGLVPTVCIMYFFAQGLIVALPKFSAEGFAMLGIFGAHIVIFGGLLYLAALAFTWVLRRYLPRRLAAAIVLGLIAALIIASNFEIYRVPGHNSAPPANIFRIITEFTR